MNFIFSKVSLMPPEGDAAGAALGARGVACFLLFLEEASLLFVLRFYPWLRVRCSVAQMQQMCAQDETELAARTRRGCGSPSCTAAVTLVRHPWRLLLGRCGCVCGRLF